MAKDVSQLKNQARREEQREHWSRAIELYRKAIDLSVEAGDVSLDLSLYNRVGDLHRRQDDVDRAIDYYLEAVDRYAEQGLYTSAIALCNKILRLAPDRLEVHRSLGRLHAATGLTAEARKSFETFCEGMAEAGREEERREGRLELAELTDDAEMLLETVDEMVEAGQEEPALEALLRRFEEADGAGEEAPELRSRIEQLDPEALAEEEPEPEEEAAEAEEAPEPEEEAAEPEPEGEPEPEEEPVTAEEAPETAAPAGADEEPVAVEGKLPEEEAAEVEEEPAESEEEPPPEVEEAAEATPEAAEEAEATPEVAEVEEEPAEGEPAPAGAGVDDSSNLADILSELDEEEEAAEATPDAAGEAKTTSEAAEVDEQPAGTAPEAAGEAEATPETAAADEEPAVPGEAEEEPAREAPAATLAPGGEEAAEPITYRDSLTGLPNFRLMREEAPRVLARADREGHQAGLVLLELTELDELEETLGRQAAERALVGITERLRGRLRASDLAARVNRSQFAVVLSEVEGRQDTASAADRLHALFDRPLQLGDSSRALEIHVGLALYPDHGSNLEELLSNAEEALSGERGESTGRIRVLGSAGDELPDASQLVAALEEDALELHYQPILRLPDRELAGVEALVRWPMEDGRMQRAAAIVPLAERSDMATKLDRWVLEQAVSTAAGWDGDTVGEWIAVNLTWDSLVDPETPERIQSACRRHSLDQERLILQVTERTALRAPERTADAMDHLYDAGVRMALDDFGLAEAAARVGGIDLDPMRVDMLVVRGLDDPAAYRSISFDLVERCRGADIDLVAERLESADQLERVAEAGVSLVQGFHVGRPVPADELLEQHV